MCSISLLVCIYVGANLCPACLCVCVSLSVGVLLSQSAREFERLFHLSSCRKVVARAADQRQNPQGQQGPSASSRCFPSLLAPQIELSLFNQLRLMALAGVEYAGSLFFSFVCETWDRTWNTGDILFLCDTLIVLLCEFLARKIPFTVIGCEWNTCACLLSTVQSCIQASGKTSQERRQKRVKKNRVGGGVVGSVMQSERDQERTLLEKEQRVQKMTKKIWVL